MHGDGFDNEEEVKEKCMQDIRWQRELVKGGGGLMDSSKKCG